MKTVIKVSGMHCNACKMLIEDILEEHKEISKMDVKLGTVFIEHSASLDLNMLKKEIESEGDYKVEFE